MSGLVIDTSITMAWCFEDESTDETEALLDRVVREGAVVPQLWTHEISNVLLVAERRGRVTEAQSARITSLLSQLPIRISLDAPSPAEQLALARNHGLTSYDAAYLWLAELLGLPLATLDEDLASAARAAGVETLPS